jgi:hypothetical protein
LNRILSANTRTPPMDHLMIGRMGLAGRFKASLQFRRFTNHDKSDYIRFARFGSLVREPIPYQNPIPAKCQRRQISCDRFTPETGPNSVFAEDQFIHPQG